MDISYEYKMNMIFDEPLKYKELNIYPGTVYYYSIFSGADEYLDASRLDERDKRLMRLPYLDYMYEKSLLSPEFKFKWDMMINILKIVFKDQSFDIIRENGKLYLRVYQRADDYELLNNKKEKIQNEFIDKYQNSKDILPKELECFLDEIKKIEEKMYNTILINSEEFDEIRQLIMIQNDIKSEHYSEHIESILYETKAKLAKMNENKDSIDLEDLITVLKYCGHYKSSEIKEMTIRRFNRELYIATNKDDYYLYKQLELSGMIKPNKEIPHWIKHYEPKGRFDDALISNSSLLPSVEDGKI